MQLSHFHPPCLITSERWWLPRICDKSCGWVEPGLPGQRPTFYPSSKWTVSLGWCIWLVVCCCCCCFLSQVWLRTKRALLPSSFYAFLLQPSTVWQWWVWGSGMGDGGLTGWLAFYFWSCHRSNCRRIDLLKCTEAFVTSYLGPDLWIRKAIFLTDITCCCQACGLYLLTFQSSLFSISSSPYSSEFGQTLT